MSYASTTSDAVPSANCPPTTYSTPSITPPAASARAVGIAASSVHVPTAGSYVRTRETGPPAVRPPATYSFPPSTPLTGAVWTPLAANAVHVLVATVYTLNSVRCTVPACPPATYTRPSISPTAAPHRATASGASACHVPPARTTASRAATDVVCASAVSVHGPAGVPVPLICPAPFTRSHGALLTAVHAVSLGVAVSVTGCVPPLAPTSHVGGVSVRTGSTPRCRTVTTLPATVAVPTRSLADVCDAAVSVTVPLPVPPAALTVSHAGAPPTAVHASVASPGTAVTVISRVSPAASTVQANGAAPSVAAGPVCVAATVCHTLPSPRRKVSVAVRGTTDVVYAAAVTVTVLLPTPLPGLAVSHAPPPSTVHPASPGVAITLSARVPPAAPNVSGPDVTV